MNGSSSTTILILERDPRLALEIERTLRAFGHELICIQALDELLARGIPGRWDATVIDLDGIPGDSTATSLERFGAIRPPGTPLVVLMATPDVQLGLRAIRTGCNAMFTKPLDFQILAERLQTLMQPPESDPYRILVVEDSRTQAMYLQSILEEAGMIARIVMEPFRALEELSDFQADLILLNHYMPSCDGPELAALIRLNPAYLSIPIVYLSAETDTAKRLLAMRRGADDYLTKDIRPEDLISSVQIRAERTRMLRSLMLRDSLTGLLNHTTLKYRLQEEVSRASRYSVPLAYAMIDLDHFKAVNDTYGHSVGDHVLLALSTLLQRRLRHMDIIGRYGGEEFGVVLPQTDLESAHGILDRLRDTFASLPHQGSASTFHATFSCGLAALEPGMDAESLNVSADTALYAAKNDGRNRVACSAKEIVGE